MARLLLYCGYVALNIIDNVTFLSMKKKEGHLYQTIMLKPYDICCSPCNRFFTTHCAHFSMSATLLRAVGDGLEDITCVLGHDLLQFTYSPWAGCTNVALWLQDGHTVV